MRRNAIEKSIGAQTSNCCTPQWNEVQNHGQKGLVTSHGKREKEWGARCNHADFFFFGSPSYLQSMRWTRNRRDPIRRWIPRCWPRWPKRSVTGNTSTSASNIPPEWWQLAKWNNCTIAGATIPSIGYPISLSHKVAQANSSWERRRRRASRLIMPDSIILHGYPMPDDPGERNRLWLRRAEGVGKELRGWGWGWGPSKDLQIRASASANDNQISVKGDDAAQIVTYLFSSSYYYSTSIQRRRRRKGGNRWFHWTCNDNRLLGLLLTKMIWLWVVPCLVIANFTLNGCTDAGLYGHTECTPMHTMCIRPFFRVYLGAPFDLSRFLEPAFREYKILDKSFREFINKRKPSWGWFILCLVWAKGHDIIYTFKKEKYMIKRRL